MKPLNHAERKVYRLKFLGMYCISIVLIIIILCGFLQPAFKTKTVIAEKEKPGKVFLKKIYVTQPNNAGNNIRERDSLKAAISLKQKKLNELSIYIQTQKNTIAQLQKNQPVNTAKSKGISAADKSELTELKKQIDFFNWALRSQVAITNTLTKENNRLKEEITKLNKNK